MIIDLNVLSERSINSAIRKMERRRKWLDQKAKEFVQRLQDEGIEIANFYYTTASVDEYDIMLAGDLDATVDRTVKITKTSSGYSAEVRATGESVLFVEFGTGRMFDNAYMRQYGFYPGSYGQGRGKSPHGWFYKGHLPPLAPPGTERARGRPGLIHTYGSPANAVMYSTKRRLTEMFAGIAKEVFSGD